MSSELVGEQVHVTFADGGPPVDVDPASVTMPDATAHRGRGLAMAPNRLGPFAHRCDDLGNQWTLIALNLASRGTVEFRTPFLHERLHALDHVRGAESVVESRALIPHRFVEGPSVAAD